MSRGGGGRVYLAVYKADIGLMCKEHADKEGSDYAYLIPSSCPIFWKKPSLPRLPSTLSLLSMITGVPLWRLPRCPKHRFLEVCRACKAGGKGAPFFFFADELGCEFQNLATRGLQVVFPFARVSFWVFLS